MGQPELLKVKVCKINIVNEHDFSLVLNCREVMVNLVGRNPVQGSQFFVVNCSVGKPCVTRPSGSTDNAVGNGVGMERMMSRH